MRKTKIIHTIGIIIGAALIVLGIIFIATPAVGESARTAGDYAFGADYYTEQYAATRIVTQNTLATAVIIRRVGAKLALYFGSAFIFAGILVCLSNVKKIVCNLGAANDIKNANPINGENETVIEKMEEALTDDSTNNEQTVSESILESISEETQGAVNTSDNERDSIQ